MLDHHPEIAFDKEFDFAVALVSDTGQLPSMQSYLEWIKYVRGVDYAVNSSMDYREQVNDFLRQKKPRPEGRSTSGLRCIFSSITYGFSGLMLDMYIWCAILGMSRAQCFRREVGREHLPSVGVMDSS